MLRENSLTVISALSVCLTFASVLLSLRFLLSSFIPSLRPAVTGALWVVWQILYSSQMIFLSVSELYWLFFVDVVGKAFVYCWFCSFISVLMYVQMHRLSLRLKPKRDSVSCSAGIGRFRQSDPSKLSCDRLRVCDEEHHPHPPSVLHLTLLPLLLYRALTFSSFFFFFYAFCFWEKY